MCRHKSKECRLRCLRTSSIYSLAQFLSLDDRAEIIIYLVTVTSAFLSEQLFVKIGYCRLNKTLLLNVKSKYSEFVLFSLFFSGAIKICLSSYACDKQKLICMWTSLRTFLLQHGQNQNFLVHFWVEFVRRITMILNLRAPFYNCFDSRQRQICGVASNSEFSGLSRIVRSIIFSKSVTVTEIFVCNAVPRSFLVAHLWFPSRNLHITLSIIHSPLPSI